MLACPASLAGVVTREVAVPGADDAVQLSGVKPGEAIGLGGTRFGECLPGQACCTVKRLRSPTHGISPRLSGAQHRSQPAGRGWPNAVKTDPHELKRVVWTLQVEHLARHIAEDASTDQRLVRGSCRTERVHEVVLCGCLLSRVVGH